MTTALGIAYLQKNTTAVEGAAATRHVIDGTAIASVGNLLATLPVSVTPPPEVVRALDIEYADRHPLMEAMLSEPWTREDDLEFARNTWAKYLPLFTARVGNCIAEIRFDKHFESSRPIPRKGYNSAVGTKEWEDMVQKSDTGIQYITQGQVVSAKAYYTAARIWDRLIDIIKEQHDLMTHIREKHQAQYMAHKQPADAFAAEDAKFVFSLALIPKLLNTWDLHHLPSFRAYKSYADVANVAERLQKIAWIAEIFRNVATGTKSYFYLRGANLHQSGIHYITEIDNLVRQLNFAADIGSTLVGTPDSGLIRPITPANIMTIQFPGEFYSLVGVPKWLKWRYGPGTNAKGKRSDQRYPGIYTRPGTEFAPTVDGYEVYYTVATNTVSANGSVGPAQNIYSTAHVTTAGSMIQVPIMGLGAESVESSGRGSKPAKMQLTDHAFADGLIKIHSMTGRAAYGDRSIIDGSPVYNILATKIVGAAPTLTATWVNRTLRWPDAKAVTIVKQGDVIIDQQAAVEYGGSANTSDIPQILPGKIV